MPRKNFRERKAQRRNEAIERLRKSTYANSRAKRKGLKTEAEWQDSKERELERLTAV